MKLKILKVEKYTANYEGVAYEGKYGPMQRVVIKASSPEQAWGIDEKLSTMEKLGGRLGNLKAGDVIDAYVEQKGNYWNFKLLKEGQEETAQMLIIKALQDKVDELESQLSDVRVRLVNLEIKRSETPF